MDNTGAKASNPGCPLHKKVLGAVLLFSYLALALFVPWVFANDHNIAISANDFALVTNLFDARVDLHDAS
jgi:hypothetical protein